MSEAWHCYLNTNRTKVVMGRQVPTTRVGLYSGSRQQCYGWIQEHFPEQFQDEESDQQARQDEIEFRARREEACFA